MHAIKCLGEIYKVDIEGMLPFSTLFNNISQCENMINTTPSSPEALSKAYGVIFNCLGTRAVYLDLAADYSTNF